MAEHFFISYSSVDGRALALRLADELAAGPPAIPVWLDKRHLRPGESWDDQLVEAIRACKGLIFLMTADSVSPGSGCKDEWVRALRYKKPVIPLLAAHDAELPYRLGSREYIDATGSFETALARLRKHLTWMDSPAGQLAGLKHRLQDAQRDLPRAEPEGRARIEEEIAALEREIVHQQAIVDDPGAVQQRVRQTIARGLERAREPVAPVVAAADGKFIYPPPLVAPTWFQNRQAETRLIGDFLRDDALRLMTVVGRGGIGKSAVVCRLLRALEAGQLPDDGGPLPVDGIVYLSDARSFHRVSVPDLFAGLCRLLPEPARQALETTYRNPQASLAEKVQALTAAFPRGRTVVMLDNFEDAVDQESGRIREPELDQALRALLQLPPHGLKLLVTTRVAPRELAQLEPGRQRRLDLDAGLDKPYAENLLRAMDADNRLGLRDAPDVLLAQARERTRGYPRALEHLFGILSADRDTSLQEILDHTGRMLPEQVMRVLVGEAFSRLDTTAQHVMQALAIYRYPVPAAALDHLLQPYVAGIDSGPVLSRLVNMQFVRRDKGRYHLHQTDRDYAEGRIPPGAPDDRLADPAPFTRFALQHRAAEWFKLARKPRDAWKTLDDLASQLQEFELRVAGADHDTAAEVLLDIDGDHLSLWGHYAVVRSLYERLQGQVGDPALAQACIGSLGVACFRLGDFARAAACYEQALALARQHQLRAGEGNWLGNLASCHAEMGDLEQAARIGEQALAIRREVGDRDGEGVDLSNLGNRYADMGRIDDAITHYQQALVIAVETNDLPDQAVVLCNLGLQEFNQGHVDAAAQTLGRALRIAQDTGFRLIEAACTTFLAEIGSLRGEPAAALDMLRAAVTIADELANAQFQQATRFGLARELLLAGDLAAARAVADAGRQYRFPLSDHDMQLLAGLVMLRQGERPGAAQAFERSVALADGLLQRSRQHYGALDIHGLACCGLVLCGRPDRADAARQAGAAARAVCSAPGVVRRVLRLFDALAAADAQGALAALRPWVAGEQRA